jgi:serine-type D-Ala-D-Ala carboxypeptidase/endopeptidase (penicillin-binding protein 4)
MLDCVEGMAGRRLGAIAYGRPSLLALTFAATLALTTATYGWPAVSSAPNLDSSISRLLSDPGFRPRQKSAYAVSLIWRQTIFDIDGDALLIPVSTTKLITSAAALLRLSSHYRFHTAFLIATPLRHGGLQGDFYLKRYGDPGLVLEEAWLLTGGLRKQGVHRVSGELIGDDSFFDDESRRPKCDDAGSQRTFNAKIGALSGHFNRITIVTTPGLQPGDPIVVAVEQLIRGGR